jgi:hypothetical protein
MFESTTTTWTPIADEKMFLSECERRAGANREEILKELEMFSAHDGVCTAALLDRGPGDLSDCDCYARSIRWLRSILDPAAPKQGKAK